MREDLTVEPEAPDPDEEPAPDDRDLVRRSRDGDQAAFGILIRRYQRRIFALGVRYFRDPADAEDVVQETFLRAWRAIDRFDVDRPVAPWLFRIATNWSLTQLAARRRRGGEELTETIRWTGPSPEEDLETRRRRERIERALGDLPEDQRMILILRVTEDLSYREISEMLDIPIGTVMSRLSRARETLRKRVQR